jgi:hypothetical protein
MTTMTAAQVREHTGGMTPDPEVPERPRPPRSYPAAYKLRILAEYEQLDKQGKGTLLRREGLYTSLISEWRKQRDKGALAAQPYVVGSFGHSAPCLVESWSQGFAGCLRSQSAATAAGSAPSSWTRWFMPMRSRVVSWPVTASTSRTSAGP